MNTYLKLPETFMDKLKHTNGKTEEQTKGLWLHKQKVGKINRKFLVKNEYIRNTTIPN